MNPERVPFPKSGERNEQEPLGPHPTYEHALDVAVEYTFPASDPIAVDSCCTAAERAARRKGRPSAEQRDEGDAGDDRPA